MNAISFVEHHHMHVYTSTFSIRKNEVPFRANFSVDSDISVLLQAPLQHGSMFGLDSDVQILMRTCLATNYGVDGPAAIDPDRYARSVERVVELNNICGIHRPTIQRDASDCHWSKADFIVCARRTNRLIQASTGRSVSSERCFSARRVTSTCDEDGFRGNPEEGVEQNLRCIVTSRHTDRPWRCGLQRRTIAWSSYRSGASFGR
ncbi:MAG: hypothetical protein RIE74_12535, partial [Pseudomonadales bacterium]